MEFEPASGDNLGFAPRNSGTFSVCERCLLGVSLVALGRRKEEHPMSTQHQNLPARSLDEQRAEYSSRRFLAMPLAGVLAWSAIGIGGALLPPVPAVLLLFIASGSTVYLGMFISRFTGERFLDRNKPKNAFDALFFHTVAMALLVYAIAVPFFLKDYTSLPLTVGILTGLMWLPLSWVIQHWVGVFHAVTRTALVTLA